MNFIVGFILEMSGGNEVESFWLFASLLGRFPRKSQSGEELYEQKFKFDGIKGFYKKNFPILMVYCEVFEIIF
jgi:hypothetical protein